MRMRYSYARRAAPSVDGATTLEGFRMKLLKSSILVALAALGACQAFGNVYQVHSRTSLPVHLDPLGFPTYEQLFLTQPSWGAVVDTHPLIARMDNARNVWYLQQGSATG